MTNFDAAAWLAELFTTAPAGIAPVKSSSMVAPVDFPSGSAPASNTAAPPSATAIDLQPLEVEPLEGEPGEGIAEPGEWGADGWPADSTPQPPACARCGSLDGWQTLADGWRCSDCDPPQAAERLRKLAERLRTRYSQGRRPSLPQRPSQAAGGALNSLAATKDEGP